MKRAIRGLGWLLAAACAALLAASFAGPLHGAGDALAVLRWQLAAGLAGLALLLRALAARRALWLVLAAALSVAPVGWAWLRPQPAPPPPGVTLYQKNLLFRLADPAPLLADIRAAAPDVLTLQEVTPRHRAILQALDDILPTRLWCPFAPVGGVAVASRWPAIPGTETCGGGDGYAAVRVRTPDGPLWLVSVHLHWPWPRIQPAQVSRIVPVLRAMDGPVLMGGDFNMVPWGHAVRRLARAARLGRIGRAHNSFPRFGPLAPLPIDLVFGPAGSTGTTWRRPLLGSDHHGILARIGL